MKLVIFVFGLMLSCYSYAEILQGCLAKYEECEFRCVLYIARNYGTVKFWGQSYVSEIDYEEIRVLGLFNVDTVYRKIFKEFSLLESLEIRNQSITEIRPKTFQLAKKLRYLVLDDNKITKLSFDTFEGAEYIEQLSISFNQITTIAENTFQNLMKIKILYLSDNKIAKLHDHTFKPLHQIENVYLGNNQIEFISRNLFKYNSNLIVIDLSGNRLKWIHNHMFNSLGNLDVLLLNKNDCINRDFVNVKNFFAFVENNLKNCSIF